MAVRATKRGADRTPLDTSADVVICGASFAGLAAARELRGSGADVLVVDRYEIGERQTSACAIPTGWLDALDLRDSLRQNFDELVLHRRLGGRRRPSSHRWRLSWDFATFDYRTLCELLAAQGDFRFETAMVQGIERGEVHAVETDRGTLRAPVVIDALGWRRVLSEQPLAIQPPDAYLSRGLEVHPAGRSPDLEIWLDPRYVTPGYGWSFPAGDEVRVGVGSFDPRLPVKGPTVQLADDVGIPLDGYQGNWIPHRLGRAVGEGVFFAGDSAGHCFPATAEGIRPALYFGLAAGREARAVYEGRSTRDEALARYETFHESHRRVYEGLYYVQRAIGRLNETFAMDVALAAIGRRRVTDYCFGEYWNVAAPDFARAEPTSTSPPSRSARPRPAPPEVASARPTAPASPV
ncbi:MAG: NAD(P)/FAD-dependent oxidoreductase [Baekduia sp.]